MTAAIIATRIDSFIIGPSTPQTASQTQWTALDSTPCFFGTIIFGGGLLLEVFSTF